MVDKRQKTQIQMKLPFVGVVLGETLFTPSRVESPMARYRTERPADTKMLMEVVVEQKNVENALKRIKRNKGGPGIDGMTIAALDIYLQKNWSHIRTQLLQGDYRPQPVKRVEIPKPTGGVRKLGIPTVTDRLIQQMLLQVLQKQFDPTFSEYSYGFRPGRSAHQAIEQAQAYIKEGFQWVVDIDLEKFFDRVNHDILMSLLAKRVSDKRVLKLIRGFLNAGVFVMCKVIGSEEGTPQGGPLSPLLSNITLDVLDQELEKRGHKFVRYADDCNIYVKTERAGIRVMESVSRFLVRNLKLIVNQRKSAVGRVYERKFLGFSFSTGECVKRRIAPQSIQRFKSAVRQLTRRTSGRNLESTIVELSRYLRGWIGYYGFCEATSVLKGLDSWLRRRLRSQLWKQWKTPKNRFKELRRRGVSKAWAKLTSGSGKGPWHISCSWSLHKALPNKYFDALGLPRLAS